MTRRVYFFGGGQADGDPERKDILGGKGASLAAMTRAHLPVPAGFTISAECCGLFLAADGAWPDGLEQEVRGALGRLERAAGRRFGAADDPLLVSVRSGAAVSMPGMMDTILNCPMPGGQGTRDPWRVLAECIEAVFNSWNSPRAIAYRRHHDIGPLPGTAVTVQAMFPSQVSGVAFTANPNDPAADEMVIESAYGLGEAVVSGEVHPDNFVLDRKDLTVKRRLIRHKARVLPAADDASHPDPDAPSLSDPQIRQIASMAMDIEKLFGFPVDVEWGLADGRFAVLQARPVRPAQTRPQEQLLQSVRLALGEEIRAGRGPWVLHNLSETLPHPTPLTWSVQGRFMSSEGGFGAMYRLAGFEPAEALRSQGIVRLVAGRVYMDTSLAPEMFFENYPFKYDMNLLRWDPDAAQSPPTLPAGTLRGRLRAARRIAAVHRRLHETADRLDAELNERTIPEFAAWCRRQRQRSLAEMSPDELVELWRQRERRVMDEFAPQSLLPSLVSGMALAELRAFLAENFWDADEAPGAPGGDADELAGVLAAPPAPDRTMQANADLFAVARGQRTVEQWLDEHGHRGPDELDLASPRWRERPDEVAAMAQRLKDGQDPMALHHAHLEEVESRTRALRARLGPKDRRQFDRLIDLVKRYIPFREDGKYYLMLGYDLLRDVAIEAGRRLGLGDDVFFLTVRELHDALAAGEAPAERIARRKAAHRAETRAVLPRLIDAAALETLGTPPMHEAAESYPAHELSAGVASGPVRIVTSLADADRLGHGYILVCRSTDPAWTPLFVNAAGLVLECGGTLSHGAVVAREMGIPAVVLPDATSLLQEGQLVAVDGHRGRVGKLDRSDRSTALTASEQAEQPGAAADDVRIPCRMAPPPRGRRERIGATLRNIALGVWGTYLLAVLLLPGAWLYRPSLAVLDKALWPLVANLGKPAAVAIAAAAVAVLTMVAQRLLGDNRRLHEAKRRAGRLLSQAARLDRKLPRRAAITRLAAPVNVRLLAAAMLPISLLLGPLIMTFFWFPARVDPASWNAPPGTTVKVTAIVDSGFRGPVTLTVAPPARLAKVSRASRKVRRLREALDDLLAELRGPAAASQPSWEKVVGPGRSRAELRASLEAYLDKGVPPQGITWQIETPKGAEGSFPVRVSAGDARPVRLDIVLGESFPPAPLKVAGDSASPIRSAGAAYPPPEKKRIFLAPLAALGNDRWDAGWLLTYLAAYLPVMFVLRWILRIA